MKTLYEILQTKGVKRKWLIENLIPRGEIVILYAQQNMYKTFLSVKIALEVATGSQELGVTENGNVSIYSAEASMEDLITRIKGLHQESYSDHDFSQSLSIEFGNDIDLTQSYPTWCENYDEEDEDFWTWKDMGAFTHHEDKLIIIDTLSQSIGINSINDDIAIRTAIKNLKKWIEGSNGFLSILVIAHASNKNPSKGIMGTSILHNDFPTVLKVKKTKSGTLLVREKMKSNAEGTSIPFKMRSTNVDGCVTSYVDIGKELSALEYEIINLSKQGLSRDNIRDNTYKTHGQQYNNKKTYFAVFGRAWNSLLKQGFIDSGQQGNK